MNLFTTLAYFYLLILIGTIVGRISRKYNIEIRKVLSFIFLYILTPPLIIFAFILPNFNINFVIVLYIIIFQLILCSSTQLFIYLIALRKKEKISQRFGSMLMSVSQPNAMLFPLPIVLSIFGSEYIIILVIFALMTILHRGTWLTYLCIKYGGKKGLSYKDGIRRFFTFPPTLAIIVSIVLLTLNIKVDSKICIQISDFLSIMATIIGALIIGFLLVNLKFNSIKEFKKDFGFVLIVRVFFSFVLFFILIQIFIFPIDIRTPILVILLLVFVDPPAVSNTVYAEYFELDKEFTAFCTIMITLLAIIYVPLILLLGVVIF